jgi:hypothetical protein
MQTAVPVDDKTEKMVKLHPVWIYDFYRDYPPVKWHKILENHIKFYAGIFV